MLKGKNKKCLRSGLRSDWSHNFNSGNAAGCDFFQYIALHKLHRHDQKTVVKHFAMSISFCQLLDDLSFYENCDIRLDGYR